MSVTHRRTSTELDGRDARGWVRSVGRWGWAAKGAVYVLVGLLSLALAAGGPSGEEASRQGAIDVIAGQPWSGVLLVALIVGLLLYATWRTTAALSPGGTDGRALVKRVLWLASAAVYVALAKLAFDALTAGRQAGSPGRSTEQGLAATALATGWGRWLVAAVGLGVLGVAVHTGRKAVDERFRERLDERAMPEPVRRLAVPAGRIGLLGRSAAWGLIGLFLVRAAWQADASEAGGLDEVLRHTASGPLGTALVLAIATGLVVYGTYAVLTAPYRQLASP